MLKESKYLSLSRMKPFCTCMNFSGEGTKDWMVKERPRIVVSYSALMMGNSFQPKYTVAVVFIVILGLFALFWLAFTCFHFFWLAFTSYKWRQFVCECSVNVSLDTATKRVRMLDRFRSFKELLLVIPAWAWVKFGEERTEHRSTLFGTDIDVIQLENFLIEFVPMEKSEGWIELL